MINKNKPIGLFDSGLGGLTILQELAELMPEENFVYFGDTANLPYGDKPPQALQRLALENALFLLKKQIKLLVVACYTACSHTLTMLQKALPIPVLGVTLPGVEQLIKNTKTNSVAILGTASTIHSNILQTLLLKARPNLTIHSIPCPLFVPIIEEGLQDHPIAHLITEHYLSPLRSTNVDSVLLGCTHYPLLIPAIQSALGSCINLITPAKACGYQIKKTLEMTDSQNSARSIPYYHFYVSDDPVKFHRLAKTYFSKPIRKVTLVKNKIL